MSTESPPYPPDKSDRIVCPECKHATRLIRSDDSALATCEHCRAILEEPSPCKPEPSGNILPDHVPEGLPLTDEERRFPNFELLDSMSGRAAPVEARMDEERLLHESQRDPKSAIALDTLMKATGQALEIDSILERQMEAKRTTLKEKPSLSADIGMLKTLLQMQLRTASEASIRSAQVTESAQWLIEEVSRWQRFVENGGSAAFAPPFIAGVKEKVDLMKRLIDLTDLSL